jgi:hypothetical protein
VRVAAAVVAAAFVVLALAGAHDEPSHPPPPTPLVPGFLCLQLDIHGNLLLIDFDLGIVIDVGAIFGYPACPPPPPTMTTTTSTTTTTLPPTTTTTTTLPPPPPPPPPPAQLSVSATVRPSPPVPGQPASVVLLVRNDGAATVHGVQLVDELSQVAALRSATSPAGPCRVTGRRAACPLGSLAPGEMVTAELRLLMGSAPASRTLLQHLSLSTGTEVSVTDRSVSALVGNPPSHHVPLTDLPGPTVTLVAFVGFVLASGGTRAR